MRYASIPLQIRQPNPPGTVRIYRLEVTYPTVDIMLQMEDEGLRFPRNRRYLSRNGAESRARLFRELGCHVKVIASKPVKWEE